MIVIVHTINFQKIEVDDKGLGFTLQAKEPTKIDKRNYFRCELLQTATLVEL